MWLDAPRAPEEDTMAKARRVWIVTKHGPLQKLDDNLWAVEGDVQWAALPGLQRLVPFHGTIVETKAADALGAAAAAL
jgi:hypothetical protein